MSSLEHSQRQTTYYFLPVVCTFLGFDLHDVVIVINLNYFFVEFQLWLACFEESLEKLPVPSCRDHVEAALIILVLPGRKVFKFSPLDVAIHEKVPINHIPQDGFLFG